MIYISYCQRVRFTLNLFCALGRLCSVRTPAPGILTSKNHGAVEEDLLVPRHDELVGGLGRQPVEDDALLVAVLLVVAAVAVAGGALRGDLRLKVLSDQTENEEKLTQRYVRKSVEK